MFQRKAEITNKVVKTKKDDEAAQNFPNILIGQNRFPKRHRIAY